MPEEAYCSLTHIIHFYEEQLKHFKKVGIGNLTRSKQEHGVIITPALIKVTVKRLNQLLGGRLSRENKSTMRVTRWRLKKTQLEKVWRLLDDYTNDRKISKPKLNGSLRKTDSVRGHNK